MHARSIAALVVALVARPAAAGFDLTIDPIYTLDFTPDVVVDFESLAIGEILESGDPVAAGVTFGGAAGPTLQQAIVVDTGGGNRALQQINLGSPETPALTEIAFTFAQPARSAGAESDAVGNYSNLFPLASCYGAGDEALNFASVGGSVNSFFGFRGEPTSTPITVLTYGYATDEPPTGMTIDDLAIQFAPEPGAAPTAAIALASLASLVWRRTKRT